MLSIEIKYEVNNGEKFQVKPQTLLRNLDVHSSFDISIEINHHKAVGDYFVSDFIVGFFKAAEQIFSGSKYEKILLSLSPETNFIEIDDGHYVLYLWDSTDRIYKKLRCTYEEFIQIIYFLKLEYEIYLKNKYHIENMREFQLFHLGFYSKLI